MLTRSLLCLLTLAICGCGDTLASAPKTFSPLGYVAIISDSAFEGEMPDRPRLSFRSERQIVHSNALQLVLKLGWDYLGVSAEIGRSLNTTAASLLDVFKHARGPDSRIFKDENGHFDVSPEEPMFGHCEYLMAAQMRLATEAYITVAGVRVESEGSEAKLVEVAVADQFFPIEADKSLADYEEQCRQGFGAYALQMQQDLTLSLHSKVVVNAVGDSRIDALQAVLSDKDANFNAAGHKWHLVPLHVVKAEGKTIVSGRLEKKTLLGAEAYEFRHTFAGSDLTLQDVYMAPRGVDPASMAALELSAFYARNAALQAASQGQKFTLDTDLLPAI